MGASSTICSAGRSSEIARSALQATGIPREMAAAFRPWLVTLSLAMAPCERRRAAAGLTALDARLAEAGKLRGKPIIGLETIESQMRALAAVPEADQLQVLRVSLKYHDRSADLMETMIQRYLERDLGAMWPFQLELAKRAGLRTEAFASFEQQLVGDRNARMRDAALPLLREGGRVHWCRRAASARAARPGRDAAGNWVHSDGGRVAASPHGIMICCRLVRR